jgi:hypothetical protein
VQLSRRLFRVSSATRLNDLFLTRFSVALPYIRSLKSKLAFVVGILYVAIFLYIPAALYRWSIKSTALIWSPLLWAFRPLQEKEDPLHFAAGIATLTKYRISRVYSAIILCLFAIKIYVFIAWFSLPPSVQRLPGWRFISHYLVPDAIPAWHIAAAVNAALTWLVLFRAEKYLHDATGGRPIPTEAMQRFFVISFVIRNILSIYTLTCILYLTFELVGLVELPNLRIILFPW